MPQKKHITKTNKQDKSKEVEVLKSQLARALADYDNLQKRVDRERQALATISSLGIVSKILPILDMLEQAQNHLKDQGLAIAMGQLLDVLKEEGVEKISASPNDDFSQEYFEAVDTVETKNDNQDGKVAEIVSTGWKYSDGMLIRPVKVKVFKK